MVITAAGAAAESYVAIKPADPAPRVFRTLARRLVEFAGLDSALYQLITPASGSGGPTEFTFGDVEQDTNPLNNEIGTQCKLYTIYDLHIRLSPYRADLPMTGDVKVEIVDLFGWSGTQEFTLAGDSELRFSSAAGWSATAANSMKFTPNSPVNQALEFLILGKET